MRITRIRINYWRSFHNIEINVPGESTLVALIGENGVGKSSILDIINSACHRLGMSAGVDIPRGDPFSDDHDFEIDAVISRTEREILPQTAIDAYRSAGLTFDGGISMSSSKSNGTQNTKLYVTAFPTHPASMEFAESVARELRNKETTFHLSLDADRSYPPKPIQAHEYMQSFDSDWESVGHKKNRAFTSSRSKYEEWMKYLVGTDAKKATEFYQAQRKAEIDDSAPPVFIDQFLSFSNSVKRVLPHLQFLGVDTKEKTIIFNSSGGSLTFDKLSGGEREISFVVGQIERFNLQHGMLLIDEPELHLNPEMVRNWVSYLRDSVEDGQTWIATHSMEAVEAAGLECTFVVQRDQESKRVDSVTCLANQPALSILSAAVGSPAFSLSRKKFIFIEGDRQGIERDKFYRICGLSMDINQVRFMEGGGCKEVERKLDACLTLSQFADQQLTIGGIVDRDHRSLSEIERLRNLKLFVLPFHEIENAFLYPRVIERLMEQGGVPGSAEATIQCLADKMAGKWVFNRARHLAAVNFSNLRSLNQYWNNISWSILSEQNMRADPPCTYEGLSPDLAECFLAELASARDAYESLRESPELWIHCEGKQILSMLPVELSYSKQIALINNFIGVLKTDSSLIPRQFEEISEYISNLQIY